MKYSQEIFINAVKEGDVKKVGKFLNKNYYRDIITDVGETALHLACKGKSVEMVEMLINYGLNVNAKTKSGATPLIYAAKDGRFDICKKLIESGTDVSIKTKSGETALDCARIHLNIEMMLHNENKDYITKEEAKDKLYNYYFIISLLKNVMKSKEIEINKGNEITL